MWGILVITTVHLKKNNMDIVITTLSIGENYTRDYTNRLIEDVLKLTDIKIYITTDSPKIINDFFGTNDRIIINVVNRENLKIRIKIGDYSDDFNFNLRYLCFEPVKDLEDTLIIFTDCDNSFDWWDKNKVIDFTSDMLKKGYDFYGPRISYKWSQFKEEFILNGKTNNGLFWHKIYNYDLDINNTDWDNSPLPAEYLLIFYNKNKKLNKFYAQWKWFHDYLVNKGNSEGTWAEGFEIGVSSYVSGFVGFDIGWNHEIWSKILVASGYKNGHRGNIHHPTDK